MLIISQRVSVGILHLPSSFSNTVVIREQICLLSYSSWIQVPLPCDHSQKVDIYCCILFPPRICFLLSLNNNLESMFHTPETYNISPSSTPVLAPQDSYTITETTLSSCRVIIAKELRIMMLFCHYLCRRMKSICCLCFTWLQS